jgi:hypothetical protein
MTMNRGNLVLSGSNWSPNGTEDDQVGAMRLCREPAG